MLTQNYNPYVLSCLANRSRDEVFSPPALANQMFDLLPPDLWRDPDEVQVTVILKMTVTWSPEDDSHLE